jgi:hypothetical protein
VDGVHADVTGFPVLKAIAFGSEFGQFVVADLPVLVGRAYAGLNQRPADRTCLGDIYRRGCAGGDAIAEGANDTWIVERTWAAMLKSGAFSQAFQLTGQA